MKWWSYFTVLGLVYTYANGALPRIPDSNSDNDNGVNVQSTGGSGEWSRELKVEIMNGNLERVKELINSEGLDVNAVNREGKSYLHIAAANVDTDKAGEITKFLLSKGIKVDAKDNYGVTPLIGAALWDNKKSAEVLIENGADIDYQDTGKWQGTPILYSLTHIPIRYKVAKLLIAKDADVNVHFKNYTYDKNKNKWTPLHFAADDGSLYMAWLLVDAGAEVNPVDENGKTPMYYAKQKQDAQHRVVFDYLKSKGGHE